MIIGHNTGASPTGHGGATGHRTTLRDRGGRGNCCGDPNQHPHTRCYNPVFSGQEGVCRVLGGMLQPIYRSGPRLPRPFPGQSTRYHHAASFLAISPVAHSRNFGTTNYITRTYIHTSHHTRTYIHTSESAPVARLFVTFVIMRGSDNPHPALIRRRRHETCTHLKRSDTPL